MSKTVDISESQHRLLRRQLRNYLARFGSADDIPLEFLKVVNETYIEEDRERNLLNRALEANTEELTEANKKLHILAFYDSLTNLPNRRMLLDKLEESIKASENNNNYGVVLLIDIDHLKSINDVRGRDVGDEILIKVAKRLRAVLGVTDMAARLGGDEFFVLINNLGADKAAAKDLAEGYIRRIQASLCENYHVNHVDIHITPSIGASIFSGKANSVDGLMKEVDAALYQAKSAGRNSFRFFDQGMYKDFVSRINVEARLRMAISKKQFHFDYQPLFTLNGCIVGAEALLRWNVDGGESLDPSYFIPIAEQSELILQIGQMGMFLACSELRKLENHLINDSFSLSINISARQIHEPDFAFQVKTLIEQIGVQPQHLKFELTESAFLQDVDAVIETMSSLKSIGIKFSIDDFGTGFSSLSNLKRLPLDELKIDKSFIDDIDRGEKDRAIIKSIISLAKSMHLKVVAEGVETIAQRDFLAGEGCDFFQGYLYGKPKGIASIDSLIWSSF